MPEEPGGLQSMGSQRVGQTELLTHTNTHTHTHTHTHTWALYPVKNWQYSKEGGINYSKKIISSLCYNAGSMNSDTKSWQGIVLKPEPPGEISLMYRPGGCFCRKTAAGAGSQAGHCHGCGSRLPLWFLTAFLPTVIMSQITVCHCLVLPTCCYVVLHKLQCSETFQGFTFLTLS